MRTKQICTICVVLAAFFFFGWVTGRYVGTESVMLLTPPDVKGSVTAADVSKGMTEVKPDTVFVPVACHIRNGGHDPQPTPTVVPVESIESPAERDEALMAAATDWSTARTYTGELFDNPRAGRVTYTFPVQFNRVGQIDYHYEPAPIPVIKQRLRLRPTVAGEVYSNGQYSFGAGVQYGAVGLNVRALRLPKSPTESGYALGIGVQIIL